MKIRIPKRLHDLIFTHAGKGLAGVFLADLLIAWPDALSWLVAACALIWAVRHFRASFRSLDATPGVTLQVAPGPDPAVPAQSDLLDRATALNMTVPGEFSPALIIHQEAGAPGASRMLVAGIRLPV